MNGDRTKRPQSKINDLSDRLFGMASEMDVVEAEDIIRLTGMEPDALLQGVALRLKKHARPAGTRGTSLFKNALDELKPWSSGRQEEMKFDRKASQAVKKLFEDIKRLPDLLRGQKELIFGAAYRTRKELSNRDKEILDGLANDLRAKWKKGAKERGNIR